MALRYLPGYGGETRRLQKGYASRKILRVRHLPHNQSPKPLIWIVKTADNLAKITRAQAASAEKLQNQ